MTGKEQVCSRFKALHQILLAASSEQACDTAVSSSSKGWERELFVQQFLSQLFPRSCRFGSGDIVDRSGNNSGQIDILVASPLLYSLPLLGRGPRLNVAENVAAAIEVKSNLAKQWDQVARKSSMVKDVKRTSRKQWLTELRENVRARIEEELQASKCYPVEQEHPNLDARLNRMNSEVAEYDREIQRLPELPSEIPYYVVGYKGWDSPQTCIDRLKEIGAKGVLSLEPLILAIRVNRTRWTMAGPQALWAFVDSLSEDIGTLTSPARPSSMYDLTHHRSVSE